MSAPRKHPVDDLLATAEETARIMWQSYDDFCAIRAPIQNGTNDLGCSTKNAWIPLCTFGS